MRQKCNWYSLVLLVLFWTPWYFLCLKMENLDWERVTFQIRLPLNPSGDRVANGTPCFFLVLFETCILRIVSRVRVTFQSRLASNPSCGRTANAHLTSSSPPPPPPAPADDTSSLGFFWPPFYFCSCSAVNTVNPHFTSWYVFLTSDGHIYEQTCINIKWAKPKSLRQAKMAS